MVMKVLKTATKSHLTFEILVEFLNPKIGQHTKTINKILYKN